MGAGWALFRFLVATTAALSLVLSFSLPPVPTADVLRDTFVDGAGSTAPAADLLEEVEGVKVNS